jgi:hypothetical protein
MKPLGIRVRRWENNINKVWGREMDSAGSGYVSVAECFENYGCTAGSRGTANLPNTLFRIIIIITTVSTFANKAHMIYFNSKQSNLTEMVTDTFLPRKVQTHKTRRTSLRRILAASMWMLGSRCDAKPSAPNGCKIHGYSNTYESWCGSSLKFGIAAQCNLIVASSLSEVQRAPVI